MKRKQDGQEIIQYISPDGGSVTIYGLLIVDLIDEIPGYDTCI